MVEVIREGRNHAVHWEEPPAASERYADLPPEYVPLVKLEV